ncbi:DMT family transporter [Flavihumibacter rivuli]|uniref:DMT family transporter n=1 Tax=Flavihumibacter rivuli TaxID=2838156 RepID=UPI001BDE0B95|nr:DMT family transporter [Flavihumibacter rivuli]ULQ55665.1 DMT family transporter [Flavihumibacter rivuli]
MKTVDIFRLLILGALWGSSYLFMKMVAPVIGVTNTVGIRIIIAAVLLLIIFGFSGKLPEFRKYWKQYILLGILNLVLPFALITYSMLYLNASMGAIINATTPLFALLVGVIWNKESLSGAKVTGLVLGFIGVVLLVGWNPLPADAMVYLAMAMGLAAALSYAIAAAYTRKKFSGAAPQKTAAGQMTAAAILLLPLVLSGNAGTVPFSNTVAYSLLFLAVGCTAIAYTLYFQLITSAGPMKATLVTFLVPVFSLVWSVIFLQEIITAGILISLAFILGGLYMVIARK